MKVISGFTLVELLVSIAIIAIISSIAYPSYQSYIIKSRRSDAQTELMKAQLKQTSFHILNPSYSSDKNELGLLDNEFYVFSVISAGFSTYLIQANAKAAQLNDEGCTALTVDQSSNPLPTDCW
jgi:type IV pilus assembly protein PilE